MDTERFLTRTALRFAGLFLRPRGDVPIPSDFRNILVVRQHDQLGDMLCVIPTLRALRDAYPAASIALVASPINHEIMLGHPCLDRIILFDKRAVTTTARGLPRFLGELRGSPYDLAVVPSTVSVSLTSCLIARLSGAGVRIGPGRLEHRENAARFLFTHPVDLDWSATPGRHQALRNADILRPLGIREPEPAYVLGITESERSRAAALIAGARREHPRLFGVHPGAAKPGNRWPPERFAEVARLLHAEYGNGLVVTIGPRDAEVHERMRGLLDVPHLFVSGEPIRTVAALIDQLDFFLSNDTGPLHIAGALRPPILGLFGPTDPRLWAPPGRKNHFLAARDGRIDSLGVGEVAGMVRIILSGR